MDQLSQGNRTALMMRFSKVFPNQGFPKTLEEMPLTARLMWQAADPQAYAIFSGQLTTEDQIWLAENSKDPLCAGLTGKE